MGEEFFFDGGVQNSCIFLALYTNKVIKNEYIIFDKFR